MESVSNNSAPESIFTITPQSKLDGVTKPLRKWSARTIMEIRQRCEELGSQTYLVDGLFPVQSLNTIIGDSGRGKTALAYQLGLCVATGHDFLGRTVQQGLVLYADYENGLKASLKLAESICKHLGHYEVPENFLIWNVNDCGPGESSKLFEMMADFKPKLTIIDSLGSAIPELEKDNTTANAQLQRIRAVVSQFGGTVLGLHHIRKAGAQDLPLDLERGDLQVWLNQGRGAGAIKNGTDARFGVDNYRNQDRAALIMRGFVRVDGETPCTYISRAFDEDGEPTGYNPVNLADVALSADQRTTFNRLPKQFRHKDAKQAYGKQAEATGDFLIKCIGANILRKEGQGKYMKLVEKV